MELVPGTVLEGRYRVVDLVRKGGMGAVYRAQDLRLADAVCALKQMHAPTDAGMDAGILEYRFNEEMRVLTNLRHPGIPRVMDFFRQGGTCCIIMDFVEGQNLELETPTGGLPPGQVVEVADQVLDILVYLHGQTPPVLHRDIKPANLVREAMTGRIKLVDFGLARRAEPQKPGNTLAGTLGYAPAEQMQGRAERASDLYALGATMYHLLTGQPPRVFSPEPLRTVRPDLDGPMTALVDRAVGMMPEERFPSAEAMREAVREVGRGASAPAAPNGGGRERILVVD
ncbi:MAG TPA: serine/threonine-protein kinase, partial [Candidatus Xenobia bacterium]